MHATDAHLKTRPVTLCQPALVWIALGVKGYTLHSLALDELLWRHVQQLHTWQGLQQQHASEGTQRSRRLIGRGALVKGMASDACKVQTCLEKPGGCYWLLSKFVTLLLSMAPRQYL